MLQDYKWNFNAERAFKIHLLQLTRFAESESQIWKALVSVTHL